MLIALVSAQRIQTIHLLDIQCMQKTKNSYIFVVRELIKQSKPGKKQIQVILENFPNDEKLSVFCVLTRYLEVTRPLRGSETKLFISHVKPHHAVSKSTLARWLKDVMAASGVNMQVYKAHSTRAASVSAAADSSVPMESILSTAGWSSERTFAKFYKKPILHSQRTFAESVLSSPTDV